MKVCTMPKRYVLHALEGKYAIRDMSTDELVRGWRRGHRKLIWRGTEDEAQALIEQFEKAAPREELDKSQLIHFVNRAKRNRQRAERVTTSPFVKCGKCGSMVKEGHQC